MSDIRNIRRVTTYDASIPHTNNVQVNGADVIQVNGAQLDKEVILHLAEKI